jgi:hypothetical protein
MPTLRNSDEPARDVLAAEAFAVPAPDPSLIHGPVLLPDDPTGIVEPHDVLAAEEFAMPAAAGRSSVPTGRASRRRSWFGSALVLLALVLRRRRRRR